MDLPTTLKMTVNLTVGNLEVLLTKALNDEMPTHTVKKIRFKCGPIGGGQRFGGCGGYDITGAVVEMEPKK